MTARRCVYDVRFHPYRRLVGWTGEYEVEQLTPTAWYRADRVTGADEGDTVTTWEDQSGNGNHLTGTATYRRSPFGGPPWLEFNGTSDEFESAAELADVLGADMAGTVIFVWRMDTNADATFWSQAGGFRLSRFTSLGGAFGDRTVQSRATDAGGADTANATLTSSTNMPRVGGPNIGQWVRDPAGGGTVRASNNATDATLSAASGAQTDLTGTYFVGSGGGAAFLAGYLAEVIIFDVVLTTDQRRRVAGYLAFKYGVQDMAQRVRVRWRRAFQEADTTVDGFVPPLTLAGVTLNVDPVTLLLPPPYRTDLDALGIETATTEAASIGALGDRQFFVDAAAGLLYLTTFEDPRTLQAGVVGYADPEDVWAEFELLTTVEDSPTAATANLYVKGLPKIVSDEKGTRANGSIELRDISGWFNVAMHRYEWHGTKVDLTVYTFDELDVAKATISTAVYVDDVVPNEGGVGITLLAPVGDYPLDLSKQQFPPNRFNSLVWPFAEGGVSGRPIPLGYNPDATDYSPVTVAPALVSETRACPLDLSRAGDRIWWIDPAVLSGELHDGDVVTSIQNKAISLGAVSSLIIDPFMAVNGNSPEAARVHPIRYVENAINGYPALRFSADRSGNGTFLQALNARTVGSRLLVFVVFKTEAGFFADALHNHAQADLWDGNLTAPNLAALRLSGGTSLIAAWLDNAGGSHLATTSPRDPIPGAWNIACYQLERATPQLRVGLNDADTAALSVTGATSAQNSTAQHTIGETFNGMIAEVIILDALTSATDYTEAQRRQIADYLRAKYAIEDSTTAPTTTTHGTYQFVDGGRPDGSYSYAAFNQNNIGAQTRAYAIHKETGVRTELTVNTDYVVRNAFLTVINATYTSADYRLEVSLSQLTAPSEADESPLSALFSVWFPGWTDVLGAQAHVNAPIWATGNGTLLSLLQGGGGQAGILPTYVATLSAVGASLIHPDPTAAFDGSAYDVVTLRREDVAAWSYSGKMRDRSKRVVLYYGPEFKVQGTEWRTVAIGSGAPTLEVYTFLQLPPFAVSRRALSAGGPDQVPPSLALPMVSPPGVAGEHYLFSTLDAKVFECETTGLHVLDGITGPAPGLLVGQPVLLTFAPYPSRAGEATSKAMLIEMVELTPWPPALRLTLSDRRGLDMKGGGVVDAAIDYRDANDQEKQVTAWLCDDSDRADPDDEESRGASIVY